MPTVSQTLAEYQSGCSSAEWPTYQLPPTIFYLPSPGVVVDKTKKAIEVIEKLMEAGFLSEKLSIKDFLKILTILSE